MTRVLVTGATGHFGRPIVNELQARGFEVIAAVRHPGAFRNCREVVGSLEQPTALAAAAAQSDAVIHLACTRSNDRDTVLAKDVRGSSQLIAAWSRGNFVFASSQVVYGVPRGVLTEDSPLDAQFGYDLGKVEIERQLAAVAHERSTGFGLSLRTAVLFGPLRHRRPEIQYLELIHDAVASGTPFAFESEDALDRFGTSFIGDHDLARAFVAGLDARQNGAFNVAGPFCSWRDLIAEIGHAFGRRPEIRIAPRGGDVAAVRLPHSRSMIDGTRYEQLTGFRPRQNLSDVIERFARSIRDEYAARMGGRDDIRWIT